MRIPRLPGDFRERDVQRSKASQTLKAYTDAARKCLDSKESTILVQPKQLYAAVGLGCSSMFAAPHDPPGDDRVVYELRWYKLRPGHDGTKRAVEALTAGLPWKLAADPGPQGGRLALVGTSDVGTLNQVVELWRYPSATHLIEACERSRSQGAWQEAKAAIYPLCQSLTITFMHATSFSPWR